MVDRGTDNAVSALRAEVCHGSSNGPGIDREAVDHADVTDISISLHTFWNGAHSAHTRRRRPVSAIWRSHPSPWSFGPCLRQGHPVGAECRGLAPRPSGSPDGGGVESLVRWDGAEGRAARACAPPGRPACPARHSRRPRRVVGANPSGPGLALPDEGLGPTHGRTGRPDATSRRRLVRQTGRVGGGRPTGRSEGRAAVPGRRAPMPCKDSFRGLETVGRGLPEGGDPTCAAPARASAKVSPRGSGTGRGDGGRGRHDALSRTATSVDERPREEACMHKAIASSPDIGSYARRGRRSSGDTMIGSPGGTAHEKGLSDVSSASPGLIEKPPSNGKSARRNQPGITTCVPDACTFQTDRQSRKGLRIVRAQSFAPERPGMQGVRAVPEDGRDRSPASLAATVSERRRAAASGHPITKI